MTYLHIRTYLFIFSVGPQARMCVLHNCLDGSALGVGQSSRFHQLEPVGK